MYRKSFPGFRGLRRPRIGSSPLVAYPVHRSGILSVRKASHADGNDLVTLAGQRIEDSLTILNNPVQRYVYRLTAYRASLTGGSSRSASLYCGLASLPSSRSVVTWIPRHTITCKRKTAPYRDRTILQVARYHAWLRIGVQIETASHKGGRRAYAGDSLAGRPIDVLQERRIRR